MAEANTDNTPVNPPPYPPATQAVNQVQASNQVQAVNQVANTSVYYQPGQPIPVQPIPGQPIPVQSIPGQPIPVQPIPGQPIPGQPIPIQPQVIPVQPGQQVYMQVQGQTGQPMLVPVQPNPNASQSMVYYQPQPSTVQYLNVADPNVSVLSATSSISPVPAPAGEPPTYQQTVSPAPAPAQTNDVKKPALPKDIPRHSFNMYCPYCKKTVPTVVEYENNAIVWILCAILCFVYICCVPFFINDIKDAVHYCPYCRQEIARKDRA